MAFRAITIPGITPLEVVERHAIEGALRKTKGDKILAAMALGIGRTTIYRKLERYAKQNKRK